MADFLNNNKLPSILVLAVLVGLFLALRRHVRSARLNLWTAAWLVALAVDGRWLGLRGGGCQPVALEGFLDAPGGRGADVLVDGECLLQVRGSLAGVAVLQVALTKSFQGACLARRRWAKCTFRSRSPTRLACKERARSLSEY